MLTKRYYAQNNPSIFYSGLPAEPAPNQYQYFQSLQTMLMNSMLLAYTYTWYLSCACVIRNLTNPFLGTSRYMLRSIMLKSCRLCSKLCWHNIHKPILQKSGNEVTCMISSDSRWRQDLICVFAELKASDQLEERFTNYSMLQQQWFVLHAFTWDILEAAYIPNGD